MQHFLQEGDEENFAAASVTKPQTEEGLYQRIMLSIDERVNVKVLMSIWQPRLEFVVRLMLVATFLDDSFHTATNFPDSIRQVAEQGCLKWLAPSAPLLASILAAVSLSVAVLAQMVGSCLLLALRRPDASTRALIGWAIAQPISYAQFSNAEFVAESLSLVGGLLTLRAHLVGDAAAPVTRWIGRLLLPVMSLYYAGRYFLSAFAYDETNSLGAYLSSLSVFAVNVALLVGLLVGSMLVASGLRSRAVACALGLVNVAYVLREHPFFLFVRREGGEWKYDEDSMPMPNVALAEGVSYADFDAAQIYGLHRYYFFLGLSTSGALLLLAQFGPGQNAIQRDEVLLPMVARARD